MALSQSAVSELLEAFRAGQGLDLIRESVRMVLQELIEAEASEVVGAARYGRAVEQFIRSGTREAAVRAARAAEHVDPSGTSSRRTCRACRPPRPQSPRLRPMPCPTTPSTPSAPHCSPSPAMRVGAGVRADAEQYALGGLAALGARLPIPVAQQMLEIVVPLLPRQPNTYIVVDDELVAALVGVSRCTDRQLAARAAAALVDAIGRGLASATDRVVSLDRDLPGLLPALRERAQAGDEDAVRVLASWGEWHSFMTRPTQRLLEALFKLPVGQPRADFPIVSGVRTRPWCLISGSGRGFRSG